MDAGGSASNMGPMLSALAALVGAALAGGVALWNESRKRRQERQIESDRRAAERDDGRQKEVRLRVADVFTELYLVQHEIHWLSWYAKVGPARVDDAMLNSYNAAAHAIIPRVKASMGVLASVDMSMHDKVVPVVHDVLSLEGSFASATLYAQNDENRAAGIKRLADYYSTAERLWDALPERMAEVMTGSGNSSPSKR